MMKKTKITLYTWLGITLSLLITVLITTVIISNYQFNNRYILISISSLLLYLIYIISILFYTIKNKENRLFSKKRIPLLLSLSLFINTLSVYEGVFYVENKLPFILNIIKIMFLITISSFIINNHYSDYEKLLKKLRSEVNFNLAKALNI